jgi:hypothetical protein
VFTVEKDGRKTRFIEAMREVEEALRRELGPQWKTRLESMNRYEKLSLARKLQERGISYPTAVCKMLKLSGRDLEKLQLIHEEKIEDEDRAIAMAADRDAALKLREASIQPSKPILAKEIQDYAWSHNLYHDVGKYVCLELAKYVRFDDKDVNDSQRAFMKIIGVFKDLLRFAEDAKQLEKLRAERDALDILLTVSLDYLEKATSKLNEYLSVNKMYQEIFSRSLCSTCRSKILKWILAYSVTMRR